MYTFSIRTEKEGFKDSTPTIKEIQTGTAMSALPVLFNVQIFICEFFCLLAFKEDLVNSTFFSRFYLWPGSVFSCLFFYFLLYGLAQTFFVYVLLGWLLAWVWSNFPFWILFLHCSVRKTMNYHFTSVSNLLPMADGNLFHGWHMK